MAPSAPAQVGLSAGSGEIAAALADARERTLALVAPVSDEDLERGPLDPDEPAGLGPRAHRRVRGPVARRTATAGAPLLRPELAGVYDAFETPRAERGDLALPRATPRRWSTSTRSARGRSRCWRTAVPATARSRELVSATSMQHSETMLQTMELAGLDYRPTRRRPAPTVPPATGHTGLELVDVPAGRFALGAARARLRLRQRAPATRGRAARTSGSAATPITNATFRHFVEGGGYERREWWSDEGWSWKEEYDITHPGGWAPDGAGGWRERRLDGLAPLDPDRPVVHVSWFEADAFARAHGARLPTEAEWEKAATWDQGTETAPAGSRGAPSPPAPAHANLDQLRVAARSRWARTRPAPAPSGCLGLLGDVWEWTASRLRRLPRLPRASLPRVLGGLLRSATTGCCAAARGRRARAWPRRASATGTTRSAARSSPACGSRGTRRERALDPEPARSASTPGSRRGTSGRWPTTCSTASRARSRSCRPSTSTTRAARAVRRDLRAARVLPDAHRAGDPRAPAPATIVAVTGAVELVELGSGTAEKTRVLLDAMAARRSAAALRAARRLRGGRARLRRGARRSTTPACGSTAWSATSSATSTSCRRPEGPRIVALLGGTIGNFPPGSRRRLLRADRGRCSARRTACCSAPTSSRTRR